MGGYGVLQQQEELKHRQLKKRHKRGDPLARAGAGGLQFFPLFGGDVLKTDAGAGQVNDVAGLQIDAPAAHLCAVDPDAAFGEHIVYGPDAPVAAL